MTDLQVFEMNPQLNFPIPEKSIYQMSFNSTAPSTVPGLVDQALTNPLQILDLLATQNTGNEEKKRELIHEIMTPHYEKQMEIERKLDLLTGTLTNFIRRQQSVNELIVEKFLRQNTTPNVEENRLENEIEEENGQNGVLHQTLHQIPNPLPLYSQLLQSSSLDIPISHSTSHSPPNRAESVSPDKLETEMSVRDFLKTTMTVQKADEKILEEERQRDLDEDNIRFNGFRVRNRPKKYKRSELTFTSKFDNTGLSFLESQGPSNSAPSDSQMGMEQQLDQSDNNDNHVEIEENSFQPIVVPRAKRAAPELTLMQNVFPSTSSYVINPAAPPHQSFPPMTVDRVSHLLPDAPSLFDSDHRSFADHSHHSSFVPYVGNQEPHHRSAFVPPPQKERRLYMEPSSSNPTDQLQNL